MTIGDKIRTYRKKNGLTQKKLGELSGTSERTIQQYEGGKRQPRFKQLQKIANALDMALYDFLDDDLFDTAASPDVKHEENLIDTKINTIMENENLNDEEKQVMIQNLVSKLEIMADIHRNNAENACYFMLNELFNQLNSTGKDKTLEYIDMLTKISEYTEKEE